MKRMLGILIVLLMLACCVTAYAVEAKPGETVSVSISLGAHNAMIWNCKVSYDANVLEYVGWQAGISDQFDAASKTFIGMSGNSGGVVGTLKFKVKENAQAGKTSVSASATGANLMEGTEFSLSASGGSITIIADVCEHTYDAGTVTTPETCDKAGSMTYTCTKCGTTKTEEIPALGHAYDDGVQTKAPTCKEEGVMTYTCATCGGTKTEAIAKSDKHTWDEGVVTKEMTCLVDGEKTFTCSVCGLKDVTAIKAPGKHTYDEDDAKIEKEPTCTEPGKGSFTCTVCGTKIDGDEIPALGHDKKETVTKEANCGVDGEKTITCTRCDFKEVEKIPATGKHTYEEKVTKEPNCTDKGEKTFTCSVCGDKYTEEIAAKGHTAGADLKEKAPTCTKPGYKYFTCTVCGTEVKESDIPATGKHIYEVTEEVAPTCDKDGKRVSKCTYEGCTEVKTEVLKKLGHAYGEWVIDEENNKKTHVCSTCGNVETKSLSTHYTMTVCTYGIRFRDLQNPITKDWYMFTPIDLSVEGEQTIDLIAGNMHQIGTATVLVKDGKVTVTTKVNNTRNIAYQEEFLTFIPALADLTALDFEAMTNYNFGEEISIEEALAGDTKVLLLMRNRAWYEDIADGVNSFNGKGKKYNASVESLKELMD